MIFYLGLYDFQDLEDFLYSWLAQMTLDAQSSW